MMAEIKDVVERRRAAEASALHALPTAAPFGARLHPDLVFDYRDRCRPASPAAAWLSGSALRTAQSCPCSAE
jgi:hypothetical protein